MKKAAPSSPTTHKIIEDSILVGIIDAFGECQITPRKNEAGRTCYMIEGNVDSVLQKIYRNEPIGSLDVLKAIKAARQAIFNFRSQEEDDEKGVNDVPRRSV